MTASAKNLLIEIGTEELPPTALLKLSNAFTAEITAGLSSARLAFSKDQIQSFATPRRLAVVISNLQAKQEDQQIEKLGPAVKAAFDKEGKPSKAATGFAKSNGVSFEDLKEVDTEKGPRLAFHSTEIGKDTTVLLEDIINNALSRLPIPKRMRWGSSRTEFVRPIQWACVLFGEETVELEILGIQSSNTTQGHRFHANKAITIDKPENYQTLLINEGLVNPCFESREAEIIKQVNEVAKSIGGVAVIEEDLLDEVTALVEKPVALAGSFDESFLSVPNEALIYSMSEHQKYFHIVDDEGNLKANFITVSNIESKDPQAIVFGNEKVIRPRLADAAFFYETDKKVSLAALRDRLKPVVFQAKLGTVFEKTERIAKLASEIAKAIGANAESATKAGQLCKADLASDMVLEFDKMQGVAGAYYAQYEGLDNDVAEAIRDQYLPKFAGDKVPTNPVACSVALADRLDTLTGIFGIGQEPTGSKDPFALRRACIGIIQILLQNKLTLNLQQLIKSAAESHSADIDATATTTRVFEYLFDRFDAYYQDQGIAIEVVSSVKAVNVNDVVDFDARVKAVNSFFSTANCVNLAASNKRVVNILAKASLQDGVSIDENLFTEDAEKQLWQSFQQVNTALQQASNDANYHQALELMMSLSEPLAKYFEDVMVNADDDAIKNNRLATLSALQQAFSSVANISLLAPAKS